MAAFGGRARRVHPFRGTFSLASAITPVTHASGPTPADAGTGPERSPHFCGVVLDRYGLLIVPPLLIVSDDVS